MTSNNAFPAQACIVGVVAMNEADGVAFTQSRKFKMAVMQ